MPFLIVLLSLAISGCSTKLDFHAPTNTFVTPETQGDAIKFDLGPGLGNSIKYNAATLVSNDVFSDDIDVSTEAASTKDNIVYANASMGTWKRLDVLIKALPDSPDVFGVKWQFFGEAGHKETGWKAAVSAGFGAAEVDNEVITATNNFTSESRSYNGTLDVVTYDFGAFVGKRFRDNALAYLAPYYRIYDTKAELTSESYPDYVLENKAKQWGVNIGLEVGLNEKMYVLAEFGGVNYQWADNSSATDYSLGAFLGFRP